MKLLIKKNIVSIVGLFILVLFCLYGVYEKNSSMNYEKEGQEHIMNLCLEKNPSDEQKCIDNYEVTQVNDAHTVFSTIFSVETVLDKSSFVIPLLFLLIAIFPIYQNFKTKNFENILIRKKYKHFLRENYKKILLWSLVIPLILFIIFLFCYKMTGSFDLDKTIKTFPGILTIDDNLNGNLLKYYIFYFINIYLLFVFIGNIGLFYIKKSSNFAILLISSMITYVFIDFITDIVIARVILGLIFNIYIDESLNIFNFWTNHNVLSMEFMFGFALVLALVSSVINYFSYRNKELLFVEK